MAAKRTSKTRKKATTAKRKTAARRASPSKSTKTTAAKRKTSAKRAAPKRTTPKRATAKRNPVTAKQYVIAVPHRTKGTVYFDGAQFTTSKQHAAKYSVKIKARDIATKLANALETTVSVVPV